MGETETMPGQKEQKRDICLDLIRVIAIISVIWIHCQENGNFSLTLGGISVGALTYLYGRMGVPLFFMLTGALLIPRGIAPRRFWLTRTLPLYAVAVLWNIVYTFEYLLLEAHVPLRAILTGAVAGENLREVLLMPGAGGLGGLVLRSLALAPGEKHLWYMAFAVAVYVLMPLLAQAKRLKTYTLTVLVCVLFAVNGLRLAAGIGTGRQHVDLILYVAFVLTGYLLRDRIFGRRSMKQTEGGYLSKVKAVLVVLTVVSAAAFLATYGSDGFQNAFAVRGLDIWWYYSPFITLTAVLLFAVLVAAPAGAGARTVSPDEDRERAGTSVLSRRARVLVFFSENSFGVYLIHIAVIRVCFRAAFFTDTARTSIGTAALAAVGTLLISYTVSAVCGKIPGIRCLFLKKSLPKS